MKDHSPFKTLLKGSAIAFSGNGLIYALGFIFQLLLVRVLGAENYGIWGFAYAIILTAAQFSAMGLGLAVIYFISGGRAGGGLPPAPAARSAILLSFFSALAAALLLPAAAKVWIVPAYPFPGLYFLLTILSASIPLLALTGMLECVFRGHQDAAAAFRMKLLPESAKVVVVPAVFLLFGAGTAQLGAAVAAIALIPAVYGLLVLNRRFLPARELLPSGGAFSGAGRLVNYAMPVFAFEILQIFRDRTDIFIIGYMSTAAYLGIYKGAYIFAAAVFFIPNAVSYLLFPLLSRIAAGGGREELAVFGERTIKLTVYLGLPAVAGIAAFARPLMETALGPEFLPGERAVFFLTISSGTSIFHVFYAHILAAKNRMPLLLLGNAIAFGANLALNILLIPGYGITGAALASLAGGVLLTSLLMRFSAAQTGGLIFPRRTLGAIALAAIFLSFAYYFRERTAAVSAAAFAAFCAAWAVWLRIMETEELDLALRETRNFLAGKIRVK